MAYNMELPYADHGQPVVYAFMSSNTIEVELCADTAMTDWTLTEFMSQNQPYAAGSPSTSLLYQNTHAGYDNMPPGLHSRSETAPSNERGWDNTTFSDYNRGSGDQFM